MNKRQAKKKLKMEHQKYIEYLRSIYDEEEIECINIKCKWFDMVGINGGGCYANNSFQCPLA